jgi:hypothetical protein
VVPSTAGHFPPQHVTLDVYPGAEGATGTLYLDDGETRAYRTGHSATLALSVTGAGRVLDLAVTTTGEASFRPQRLSVRVHGASPARSLRFEGRSYPMTVAEGVASADIPLD